MYRSTVFTMKTIYFRTLYADEIEVRPSHIKNGKANLLLYIDSRAVVSLLNESVGNLNWQSKFYEANRQLIGEIGIYDDERKMWIWKSDTGSESNIEAEKGLISDIYKRVMSRWGVCELYSAPRISVPDDGYGNSGYKVAEILYNEQRTIIHLVIVNRHGDEVFRWDSDKQEQTQTVTTTAPTPTATTREVSTSDDREQIIQSIIDKANEIRHRQDTNQEELEKFVNFYINIIKTKGWKGQFRFDTLFSRWMDRIKK